MRSYLALTLSAVFGIGFMFPALAEAAGKADPNQRANTVGLASAAIVAGEKATDLERLAAKEVQRYLYRVG